MAFTIDVHHHILPDIFWRATNEARAHAEREIYLLARRRHYSLSGDALFNRG